VRRLWLRLSTTFLIFVAVSSAAEVRVIDFGAKGDGVTVDTAAIQKAIDQATLGGSTVVFKPGVYLTGALFLQSGMEIRIDDGVVLRGIEDLAAYPEMGYLRPTPRKGLIENRPAVRAESRRLGLVFAL
jgi:polygalacturonase